MYLLYIIFLTICCLSTGCEQSAVERVPVSGRVLIDGLPLSGGTVRFVPERGRPASSAIMSDGSFSLASESVDRASELGAARGNYRIQVSSSKIIDDETIRWNAPKRYADFRTSGLTVDVDKPTENMVIDLTWGDEKPAEEDPADTELDVPADTEGAPSDREPVAPEAEGM